MDCAATTTRYRSARRKPRASGRSQIATRFAGTPEVFDFWGRPLYAGRKAPLTGLHALESIPLVITRWQSSMGHAKAYLNPEVLSRHPSGRTCESSIYEETRNLNIHFVESSPFSAGRMSTRSEGRRRSGR